MRGFGWRGKGEAFDVLPLAIETPGEGVRLYELPERAVLEVPLAHPEYGWFAELGLRWHAVPAISNMRLTIGGVHYPLAPFNGWYMGTEIGARNLADADRYDMLPIVAAADGPGHQPRVHAVARPGAGRAQPGGAVVVRAGRRQMTDHHTESQRFLDAPAQRGEGRPPVPGRLELDRAADVRRRHPGLPPLLRGGGCGPPSTWTTTRRHWPAMAAKPAVR